MPMKMQKRVSLDWDRLLGFDQVERGAQRKRSAIPEGVRCREEGGHARLRLSSLGAKVGGKGGLRRAPH